MGAYYDMVNESGKGIAALGAMQETGQIMQLKNLIPQIEIWKKRQQIVKSAYH